MKKNVAALFSVCAVLVPASAWARCVDLSGLYEVTDSCVVRSSAVNFAESRGMLILPSDSALGGAVSRTQNRPTVLVEQEGCHLVLRYESDACGLLEAPMVASLAPGASLFGDGAGRRNVSVQENGVQVVQSFVEAMGVSVPPRRWQQQFDFSRNPEGELVVKHLVQGQGPGFLQQSQGECVLHRIAD